LCPQRPDADALLRQIVDEVQHLAEVAADPVEGVDHDGVAGPGIGQQLVESVPVDGCTGLLVDVDPPVADAGCRERVELPFDCLVVETRA
jgi:hypothetical protein